jgi:hypothetical protein
VLLGDCLGVSLGEPAAVEGAESTVVVVTVLLRTLRWGTAVEAIVMVVVGVFSCGGKDWIICEAIDPSAVR